MKQYIDTVKHVLSQGKEQSDRTGTGTLSVFGYQNRYDLEKGFPLLTNKLTYWKGVLIELLWFMSGDTNINFLKKHNVNIWNEWADFNGDLGPVYGKQWRDFNGVDQLSELLRTIRERPEDRGHIISAWNASDLNKMALRPCHSLFQFDVRGGKLSCQLYQRSADLFLGVPFNIASYALLTHLIAHDTGREVGEFVHTFGNLHIYNNHINQCKELLTREEHPLPKLEVSVKPGGLLDFIDSAHSLTYEEISDKIKLTGYKHSGVLKGKISV